MNVRRAVSGDARALTALYSDLREWELGLLDPDIRELQLNWEEEKGIDAIMKFLTSDDIAVFLAEHGGEIVGFVTCGYTTGLHFREGALDIYVKPEHRGKGTGTALMGAAMGWFREMGCESLMVSVYAANARAADFYRKCGMTLVGETYKMKL